MRRRRLAAAGVMVAQIEGYVWMRRRRLAAVGEGGKGGGGGGGIISQ
jgi:hypothetical protein